MNGDFDIAIHEALERAQEMGITEPVLAMLSPQVPQACAIYEDVKGHALEMLPGREEMSVLLPLTLEEAARQFRRHAGPGGAIAADILEDRILADYWIAVLAPEMLNLLAFRDDKEIRRASMGYTKVHRHVRSLTERLNEDGPSLLTLKTDDGQKITVCGPSGDVAALATALAGVALMRQLSVSHEGKIVTVPIDEDQLASMLLSCFSDPKVVNEALMALRKMGGEQDQWLQEVLRRPELSALAEQVERERTGQ